MISEYPKEIVAGMGARYIDGVFFNIFGVYSISYLTQQLKVPRTEALLGVTAAALIMCAFIPFFGRLSDRVGRTNVYFWGSLVTGFSALPAFWIWMNYPDRVVMIWTALIIPFAVFYASSYGPRRRCSAICFGRRFAIRGFPSCTNSPVFLPAV
jgi:MHS family shikimate/dehydroshikimate transporter-like MFS transporter